MVGTSGELVGEYGWIRYGGCLWMVLLVGNHGWQLVGVVE